MAMKKDQPDLYADWTNLTQDVLFRIDQLLQRLTEGNGLPPLSQVGPLLTATFKPSPDLVIRTVETPAIKPQAALLAYLSTIVDAKQVDQDVAAALISSPAPPNQWDRVPISQAPVKRITTWKDVLQHLAQGWTLVFAPGITWAWGVDTTKFPSRSIGRPQTELTIRGPMDAFTELLTTQMGQLRQRFHDPALTFHPMTLGQRQHTDVAVAYLRGLANPALIDQIIQRLKTIDFDGRSNASEIAGLIRDHPQSIFPTIRSTERVDIATRALLEGKAVILVDGDPFILIAPAPLADFYRTAMDYSGAWYDISFVRVIRLFGWIMGIYLPALYIALTEVNTNLLPPALLILIAGDHAGLPFTPLVEALLMVLVIEVLREAALRLPKALSTTIGTVGAIVVGTAVVKAGLVSPQMIVVITLTALSFYSVPVYDLTGTWRLVNAVMLLASAMLGLYGIIWVTMVVMGFLTDLTSFGTPYFVPFAPFRLTDWRDLFIRQPWTRFRRRLTTARPRDIRTMGHSHIVPPPHLKKGRS